MALKNWASRLGYKEPPPTLVVYFHQEPVAELKKEKGNFLFRYLDAFFDQSLPPLPGLPAVRGEGFSMYSDLPSFFRERLPDTRRPEIRRWIVKHGLDESDELKMLASLGAYSITDSFELKLSSAA